MLWLIPARSIHGVSLTTVTLAAASLKKDWSRFVHCRLAPWWRCFGALFPPAASSVGRSSLSPDQDPGRPLVLGQWYLPRILRANSPVQYVSKSTTNLSASPTVHTLSVVSVSSPASRSPLLSALSAASRLTPKRLNVLQLWRNSCHLWKRHVVAAGRRWLWLKWSPILHHVLKFKNKLQTVQSLFLFFPRHNPYQAIFQTAPLLCVPSVESGTWISKNWSSTAWRTIEMILIKWSVQCVLPCHGEIPLTKAPTSSSICSTDISFPMTHLLTIASMRSPLFRQLWPCLLLKTDTVLTSFWQNKVDVCFFCSCVCLDSMIRGLSSSLPEDLGHNIVCLKSPTACKTTQSWAHIRAHSYENSSLWVKAIGKALTTQ